MKKIIWSIFLFFLFIYQSFAALEMQVSSDIDSIYLGENFTFTVSVSNDADTSFQILSIKGLDNFEVKTQSQFRNIVSTNNTTQVQTQYQYTLWGKKQGIFTLWPVVIETPEGEVESNSISISILPKIENSHQREDKQEIFGVKNRNIDWKNLFYSPSLIFVFIAFLLSMVYFLTRNVQQEESEDTDDQKIDFYDELLWDLKLLERKTEALDKYEFYAKFNGLFRKYLAFLWIENSQQITLTELRQSKVSDEIIHLFEQSYTAEFSSQQDTSEKRYTFISQLRDIIKK